MQLASGTIVSFRRGMDNNVDKLADVQFFDDVGDGSQWRSCDADDEADAGREKSSARS